MIVEINIVTSSKNMKANNIKLVFTLTFQLYKCVSLYKRISTHIQKVNPFETTGNIVVWFAFRIRYTNHYAYSNEKICHQHVLEILKRTLQYF